MKTEVLEYDDVIHRLLLAWRMLRKGCYAAFMWMGKNDSIFFENGEKNFRFQKYPVRVEGA